MAGQNIHTNSLWGIVLAAGEGNRISNFIQKFYGLNSPKQYIAFTGKRSMLQHTIQRAERLILPERTLVVVNPKHMGEIKRQLSGRPRGTIIFQPYNRETAPGVLLPLIHIFKRDPEARIAIFPSDHFVLEEDRFMCYIESGDKAIQHFPEQTILLGVQPDAPEVEYGWIEPAEPIADRSDPDIRQIRCFIEKPDRKSAIQFFEKGYLWNTFVTLTKAKTLINMAKECLPHIWIHFERMLAAIGTSSEHSIIEKEYRKMDGANLSSGLLEKNPANLSVIEVKNVFWSDWGSGERVLETLRRLGKVPFSYYREDSPLTEPYIVVAKEGIAV